jgi:hypothetical protein
MPPVERRDSKPMGSVGVAAARYDGAPMRPLVKSPRAARKTTAPPDSKARSRPAWPRRSHSPRRDVLARPMEGDDARDGRAMRVNWRQVLERELDGKRRKVVGAHRRANVASYPHAPAHLHFTSLNFSRVSYRDEARGFTVSVAVDAHSVIYANSRTAGNVTPSGLTDDDDGPRRPARTQRARPLACTPPAGTEVHAWRACRASRHHAPALRRLQRAPATEAVADERSPCTTLERVVHASVVPHRVRRLCPLRAATSGRMGPRLTNNSLDKPLRFRRNCGSDRTKRTTRRLDLARVHGVARRVGGFFEATVQGKVKRFDLTAVQLRAVTSLACLGRTVGVTRDERSRWSTSHCRCRPWP